MEIIQVPMVRETNQESYSIQEFPILKERLSELCRKYKNLVVTEDAISEAKVDRAYLNKRKKFITDERIRLEKITFAWYLRKITFIAILGYAAGALTFALQSMIM